MTQQPQQHCDHECVCEWWRGNPSREPCCPVGSKCEHDTRSRPAPSSEYTIEQIAEIDKRIRKERTEVAAQVREDVLNETIVEFMLTNNRNHGKPFNIDDIRGILESLRTGGERR